MNLNHDNYSTHEKSRSDFHNLKKLSDSCVKKGSADSSFDTEFYWLVSFLALLWCILNEHINGRQGWNRSLPPAAICHWSGVSVDTELVGGESLVGEEFLVICWQLGAIESAQPGLRRSVLRSRSLPVPCPGVLGRLSPSLGECTLIYQTGDSNRCPEFQSPASFCTCSSRPMTHRPEAGGGRGSGG